MNRTKEEFGEDALKEIQQTLMFYAKPANWKDKKVIMDGGMRAIKTLVTFLEWCDMMYVLTLDDWLEKIDFEHNEHGKLDGNIHKYKKFETVTAAIVGEFIAIHMPIERNSKHPIIISHIPTGFKIIGCSKNDAKRLAQQLADDIDWDFKDESEVDGKLMGQWVKKIVGDKIWGKR